MAKPTVEELSRFLSSDSPLTNAAKEELEYWIKASRHIPINGSAQVLHAILLRHDSLASGALRLGTGVPHHDLLRYSSILADQDAPDHVEHHFLGFNRTDIKDLGTQPAGTVTLGALLGTTVFVQALGGVLDKEPNRWNPGTSVVEQLARHISIESTKLATVLSRAESGSASNTARAPLLLVTFDEQMRLVVTPVAIAGEHPFAESSGDTIQRAGLLLSALDVFTEDEIIEFQALLSLPTTKEVDLQRFLASHPRFLYVLGHHDYDDFRREVELPYDRIPLITNEIGFSQTSGECDDARVDFMLRRSRINRWDPLEIKLPKERVVVGGGRRATFSQHVQQAVSQLRDYAKRLRDRHVQSYLQNRYGMKVSTPRPLLLIGRDYDEPGLIDRIDILSSEISADIGLYTYDSLRRLAERRRVVAQHIRSPL